jgi:hypothetical protein
MALVAHPRAVFPRIGLAIELTNSAGAPDARILRRGNEERTNARIFRESTCQSELIEFGECIRPTYYWAPRSECIMQPASSSWLRAMARASVTSSVRMWEAIDQPITSVLKQSITVAK